MNRVDSGKKVQAGYINRESASNGWSEIKTEV